MDAKKFVTDPLRVKRFHGIATLLFVVLIPVSVITGWIFSTAFISALSLWALVGMHWGAYISARVEIKQDPDLSNDLAD